VLFLSIHDVGGDVAKAREMLDLVPMVALTRGWEGMDLMTRDGILKVPTLPRKEVDPTGAGDVFAAGFVLRYAECNDPLEAAAFASCTASCVVEGVGTSTLGDRAEVERRLQQRDVLIEEGEWDE
jgi:sugar/nucleoside kinase (ribokinase family)